MTADQLKALFDAWAVIIMFVWGLLVKYFPPLAKVPNELIPWLNVLGYIVAKFVMPAPAHAGDVTGGILHGLGLAATIAAGFTNAVWARQLYEGFGRVVLEAWGARKAVPAGGR